MGKLRFENYIFNEKENIRFDELSEEEKQKYRQEMLDILKKHADIETIET